VLRIVGGLRVGRSFGEIPVPDPPVIRRGAHGAFHDTGLAGASRHAVIPTRCETAALLRGLIFGRDGRAMSPTHASGRRGQVYRHYVSPSVLKGGAAAGRQRDGGRGTHPLEQLDPLWDQMFPAEQARIVRLLVHRVEVGADGADVLLRLDGLASLVRDLAAPLADAERAAA
jgi:hypothetical protein